MTLSEKILEKLADWRPAIAQRQELVAGEAAGGSVHLTADRCDEVGCLLWEINLRRAAPLALGDWAKQVAGPVSGLMEPLKLIEIDAPRQIAMLRSEQPSKRKDQLQYYEVLLHGSGAAEVRRYQTGAAETSREQIAFALTHEAVGKLVDTLAA